MRKRRALLNNAQLLKIPSARVALVLFSLLTLSFILFIFFGRENARQTLFFPAKSSIDNYADFKFAGETRILPLRRTTEGNIRLLVEDVILGAANPKNNQLISRHVQLLSVISSRGVVYVNLSANILDEDPGILLPLELQLQGLANSILFNFPSLRKLYILVGGQVPDFGAFYRKGEYDFSKGATYAPEVLQ